MMGLDGYLTGMGRLFQAEEWELDPMVNREGKFDLVAPYPTPFTFDLVVSLLAS